MPKQSDHDSVLPNPLAPKPDSASQEKAHGQGKSRREFIKEAAVAGVAIAALPHLLGDSSAGASPVQTQGPPGVVAPDAPRPWMAGRPVYSGVNNISTGNLHLSHPVCGWGGKGGGLQMALYFNSQSTRSSALGAKWGHSFNWYITGTSPAVVVAGNGMETSYALVSGAYVPPTGIYDSLVLNTDNTWTLTVKGGTQYRFGTDGLLNSIVDLNGNTVSLTRSSGNLTQVSDAAGRLLQLGYTSGKLTSITDCESRVWSLSFDGSSRVVSVTDPTLGGNSYSTQFAYGSNNNVTSITNRLNDTWHYAYGSNNVLSSTTDPDSMVTSISYGLAANVVGDWPTGTTVAATVTDPTSVADKHGLDASGRLTARIDGAGNQTNLGYDSANNLTSMTLPSGVAWVYTYDSRGNRLTETSPLNDVTTMTYDSGDRILTSLDGLGNETQFAYDSHGNRTSVTDPLSHVTVTAFNSDGSVSQVTDPASKSTQFSYDTYGNLTETTDPLSHTTQQTWANTMMTGRTDGRGRVTGYQYDAWGRLTLIDYPTGGSTDISLTYDVEGRLTQAVDGTGTRTFAYDVWGRKTSQSDPRGNTSATYDDAGRLLSQTDASSRLIEYANDAASRLTGVSDPTTTATYGWTVDGNIALEVYPNGTQKEIGYDDSRRVTSIVHRITATNAVIVSYAATYDSANRLTQVVEQPSGDTTAFTWDDAGRLLTENRTGTRAYASSYSYDSRGNRLTAVRSEGGVTSHDGTYSYDDASRLTQCVDSATSITETYSWNADNTLASSPATGYTRLYEYDEEQRLIRIKKDYGGGTVVTAYEYGYGYDGGRRWRKDYAASVWTWYPCGVSCCAGELVEKQSDLTGATWTTTALSLKGLGIVRRNSEYHHFDLSGTAGVITNGSAAVLSSDLYDSSRVRRFTSGSAATPWRPSGAYIGDEGMQVAAVCVADPARELALFLGCMLQKKKGKCPSFGPCKDMCDNYPPGNNTGRKNNFHKFCLPCCAALFPLDYYAYMACSLLCNDQAGNIPSCECPTTKKKSVDLVA